MNKIRNILLAVIMPTLVYLTQSCTKHEIPVKGELVSGAKVAFVQASEKSASVAFYANGFKISSSSVLASGVYGGANSKGTRFPQSDYCIFPSGSTDIATYILGKVNVDSIQTSSLPSVQLTEDKAYTYYYYDNPDGTQTAKVIEDNLTTIDPDKATIQFVNLVSNAGDSIQLRVTSTSESPAPALPYTLFDRQNFESLSANSYGYNFTGTTNSYTLTFEVWFVGTIPKKLVTKTSEVVTRGRMYTVLAYGSKNGTVGFLKFINKAY